MLFPTQNTQPLFGVGFFAAAELMPAHEFAKAVEERGLDAVFLPENSHIPLSRSRPTPEKNIDIDRLARFQDPFVALSACAAVTDRIRLGTCVCLLTQRRPAVTANTIASLDRISNGRVTLGVAGGFIAEAMANHGCEFKTRWRTVRERTLEMRALWKENSMATTLPLQASGPPVLIGSNSKKVPHRVAAYADGWLARTEIYPSDPVKDLEDACDMAERPRAEVSLTLVAAPHDVEACANALNNGYDHILFGAQADRAEDLLNTLDRLAEVATRARRLV
ncbi:MAG: LLM class flavin-dependent oxidoreductase [Pseudomonadota bacterium]